MKMKTNKNARRKCTERWRQAIRKMGSASGNRYNGKEKKKRRIK